MININKPTYIPSYFRRQAFEDGDISSYNCGVVYNDIAVISWLSRFSAGIAALPTGGLNWIDKRSAAKVAALVTVGNRHSVIVIHLLYSRLTIKKKTVRGRNKKCDWWRETVRDSERPPAVLTRLDGEGVRQTDVTVESHHIYFPRSWEVGLQTWALT